MTALLRGGAVTAAEVASQPAMWRQALELSNAELAVLPRAGERVLAVGCGTSYYVLAAYASRRQQRTGSVTRAVIASEIDDLETYDRIVYLSRSGTTAELLGVNARFAGSTPTVAVCGTPDSPLVAAVDASLLIPFADEQSVVQTRFATTALAVLRRSVGDDVSDLPRQADAALAGDLPFADPSAVRHVVFLGSGWTVGLAEEAALKFREAALVFAEAYAVGEYRHGPIALADGATLVWSFTPLSEALVAAISATGATITQAPEDPQADLPRVHRAALAIAQARGIDPDRPRHLHRSVV